MVENQNASRVHDGVESMGNGQNGTISEFSANGGLNEGISFQIDGCRRLVQDEDFGFAQEGACQANELPLTDRQVFTILGHTIVETGGE